MSDGRLLVAPSTAANAYARMQSQSGTDSVADAADGSGFGDTLAKALQGVVQTGHAADAAAAKGISGEGNLTDVVMAVSRAQMALQSTTAIRDRVVQAYQDIMKMSI
ncbi:flagellar hook-basal body complex protein FliE [Lichenicola cladoniae]|uniref:Flagellar hook-basal body complex protein FliE n=1 Tax=Lichenicola cladoniae TaxID=1484109 RepID=A0A6M8HSJ3_9PROT|nr:flagellar hook-basal body complex protein FliE [Lichenicola cladoniae]NPD65441.1 flagellar hook-basal body complex protein FliE [Acetobacteraceae bacterium]QKE91489.1 flagellar hook-basal body complex protein FliE [Lichenicola cladoniae]